MLNKNGLILLNQNFLQKDDSKTPEISIISKILFSGGLFMNLQQAKNEKETYFELFKRFTRILNFLNDNKLVQAHQELQRILSEFMLMEKKDNELIMVMINDVSSVLSNVKSGEVVQGYFNSRDIIEKIQTKMNS